jgi:hypothetical protein
MEDASIQARLPLLENSESDKSSEASLYGGYRCYACQIELLASYAVFVSTLTSADDRNQVSILN